MLVLLKALARLSGWSSLVCRLAVVILRNPLRLLGWKAYERWLLTLRLPVGGLALANDPAIVEAVLRNRDGVFPKSSHLTAILRPLIGEGVFGQGGSEAVKDMRKAYFLALAGVPGEEVERVSRRLSREYLARWQAAPSGVAVPRELSRLTIDIVTECLLGGRFTPAQSEAFVDAFFTYHRRASAFLLMCSGNALRDTPALLGRMELEPVGLRLREMIQERFVTPWLDRPEAAWPPFHRQVLDTLRRTSGEAADRAALEARLLDEVAVMILAGHETTASVLSWLLWELSGGALPDGDRPRAESVEALIQESLRLYPPIAFFLRDVEAVTEFRGKTLAAGSAILVSPWTLQRHKGLWQEAERFCPARWLRKEGAATHDRNTFVPFGGGSRLCPGKHFAGIEMQAIVEEIVSGATLRRVDTTPPRPLGALTTRPHYDFRLAFGAP